MTDELVKKELERLLPASYEVNDIIWGKGLPYEAPSTNLTYVPVSEDCGYKSTEDILNKAREVYSEEYVEIIKSAAFSDTDELDPRYTDVDGMLKINTQDEGFDIKGEIDIDSATIKKQDSVTVIVSAKYLSGGEKELVLVLQDGKWYLDSPTY